MTPVAELRRRHPAAERAAKRDGLRAAELRRIARLIGSSREEALLVVGEPGAGASRLLERAAAEAGALAAIAHVDAAAGPASGFSSLAAALPGSGFAEFSRRLLAADVPPDAAQLAAEFLGLATEPGEPRRTLLVVDGADRIDATSRRALALVAGRLAGTGIRILAASSMPVPEEFAGLPRLVLGPLGLDDCVELVEQRLGVHVDEAVGRILACATSGNAGDLLAAAERLRRSSRARRRSSCPYASRAHRRRLDVSPALNGCLGFAALDGALDRVDWRFVEAADVPPGPWWRLVTTSGVR